VLVILLSTFSSVAMAAPSAAPSTPVSFTILHTNDFHGQLIFQSGGSTSNPGLGRLAALVNGIRSTLGDSNVLMVDAGDEMQGSLLSNLGDGTANGKGKPTIAAYNALSVDVATFSACALAKPLILMCLPTSSKTTQATAPLLVG
jgi:2',3'-cyclic-nucleotide 2'-phosphodiesterase (5'-nucleotidase family)